MQTMTITEMMRLSIAMPVLATISVLVAAVALERMYFFWIAARMPVGLWFAIRSKLDDGDKDGALALCRRSESVMAQALSRLLHLPKADTESLMEAFQLYRQRMQLDLSRRVGLFGTVSFIAPLIGLFGTVLGIMRAFHDLSVQGVGGPSVVAAGISEALITTAAGIGVAVVSAVLYNYFTMAARHRLNTMDLWVLELSALLERPDAET
ncbi:MAG: MotA/TolQ/ExbB proton channel family protein [Elusimicrobia bacterium]|nr:MotA/TolQ/ExbB proton channel family protein [Elusimicrobiota bacterium]